MPDRGPQPAEAESAPPGPSAPPDAAGPTSTSSPDPGTQRPPTDAEPIELASEPFELSVSGAGSGDGEAANAPAPRSRTRMIVLSSLLAAGLAGAAVLGWATWQISSQKDATVTTPAQVGGLRLDDSQGGRDTADYLQSALSAEIDFDQAVGGVYTDSAGHDVLFFGGTTLIWSPGSDLEKAFGLISDDQGAVTGVHDVPAGKYGGTMKCGTTETADGAMPVCGWADHGSLALAMFPARTEPESAKLLLQIRDAAQVRN